ncbi:flavodoxin family protein [Patescibacteria group bacterium]
MKTIVIYSSTHHQNTKKIAKIIAKTLKADLVTIDETKVKDLGEYDLIGFGSGIYMWKHHQSILDFIDKLPLMNKKTFIFSTRGAKVIKSGHKILKDKLIKKGLDIIGEFSCVGWDTYGPLKLVGGLNKKRPNQIDIDKAEKFALSLLNE